MEYNIALRPQICLSENFLVPCSCWRCTCTFMHAIEQMQMERKYFLTMRNSCFGITLHQQETGLVSLTILMVLELRDAWLLAAQSRGKTKFWLVSGTEICAHLNYSPLLWRLISSAVLLATIFSSGPFFRDGA